jgi:hypothetical protein
MFHPLLENILQTINHFEICCLGAAQKSHGVRFELNSVFGLEKMDWWDPSEHPPYNPDLTSCDF